MNKSIEHKSDFLIMRSLVFRYILQTSPVEDVLPVHDPCAGVEMLRLPLVMMVMVMTTVGVLLVHPVGRGHGGGLGLVVDDGVGAELKWEGLL